MNDNADRALTLANEFAMRPQNMDAPMSAAQVVERARVYLEFLSGDPAQRVIKAAVAKNQMDQANTQQGAQQPVHEQCWKPS